MRSTLGLTEFLGGCKAYNSFKFKPLFYVPATTEGLPGFFERSTLTVGVSMARINFDDSVESHDEFWNLLALVNGDRDVALGKLVRFFRIAQKAYGYDRPIASEDLIGKNLDEIIKSGWALEVEGGFQAIGAKKHFGWYKQKVNAAKRGGRPLVSPRNKKQTTEIKSRKPRSHPAIPLALAPAPAPALKKEKEKENKSANALNAQQVAHLETDSKDRLPGESESKRKKFSEETRIKMRNFLAAYSRKYKARYGGNPQGITDPALIGRLGHWVANISEARAIELVEVYLQIEDRKITDAMHDLWLFFRNLNLIGVALDTGSSSPQINWAKVFEPKGMN